jgi:hypothetical protein
MQVTGLDYTNARTSIELSGIEITPALWGDLRVIEGAAIGEINGGGR